MYESESTRLKREINGMNTEEYNEFKDQRQDGNIYWSLRSSFFGVSYIVLFPLISILLPFDTFKSKWFFLAFLVFVICVILIERRFGTLQAFRGRLGIIATRYKLNRVRRFFGARLQ